MLFVVTTVISIDFFFRRDLRTHFWATVSDTIYRLQRHEKRTRMDACIQVHKKHIYISLIYAHKDFLTDKLARIVVADAAGMELETIAVVAYKRRVLLNPFLCLL